MRRILMMTLLLLATGIPANAYVIQAVAGNSTFGSGSGNAQITCQTSISASAVPLAANTNNALAEVSWVGIDGLQRLGTFRVLQADAPAGNCWTLRLGGPQVYNYAGTEMALKIWAPEVTSYNPVGFDASKDWEVTYNGARVGNAFKLMAQTSSRTTPQWSYDFSFATYDTIMTSGLLLTVGEAVYPLFVTDDGAQTSNPTRLHATWGPNGDVSYSEYEYAIGTSPDNLIVGWKTAGTATEATETGLSLAVGSTYYWYVKGREDPGGAWSSVYHSDGITVVLGTCPAVADDGATTTNAMLLHAAWYASDPSGIVEYQYAIGTSPSNLIVDWKSAGTATEATETGLALVPSQTYYFYVKAKNGGGLWSAPGQSDGITIVLPSAPIVNDDGIYTPSLTNLHSTWSASDPWGVVEYQYAIGTSPSSLAVDWKAAAMATAATETGLALVPNQTYYFYVKAKNGGGLWSLAGASNGIKAAATCPIGEAKVPRVGTAVYLPGSVVTSTTADFAGLWVESQDRCAAVKINSPWAAVRGDRLDVAGIVSWTDGTPVITNPELKSQSSGQEIVPPALNNSFLADDRTESLAYMGMNPVGLLVATWGIVTRVDTTAHVFYINDGSCLADGMGPSYDPFIGLRVAYKTGWTPPAVDKTVRITGIRTVQKTTLAYDAFVNGAYRFAGETLYLPVLTLRDENDIKIIR